MKSENFKLFFKDSLKVFILRIISILVGYIYIFFISNIYGPKGVGMYSIAFTFLQFITIISRLGIDSFSLKFYAENIFYKNKKMLLSIFYKKSLIIVLVFSIIISILVYLFLPFILNLFGKDKELYFVLKLIIFVIIPFSLLIVYTESLKGFEKFSMSLLFSQVFIYIFSILTLTIFTFVIKKQYSFLPILSLEISIVFSLILVMAYWNKVIFSNIYTSDINYKSDINYINYKYILKNSLPMMFANAFGLIMGFIDTFMLTIYVSVSEVGIYNIVFKIVTVLDIFIFVVTNVLSPKIASLWKRKEIKKLNEIIYYSNKLLFILTLIFIIICFFFSDKLLSLFGADFIVGALALKILLIGKFFRVLLGPSISVLNMTGYQKTLLRFQILSILLNILLNYIFIVYLDLSFVGASIATTISFAFLFIISSYYCLKKLSINTTLFKGLI